MTDLPIEQVRAQVEAILDRGGRVVVAAQTGSGKSTQVPRWLMRRGRVLVVEPRRVACSSVGSWVAKLEGVEPGGDEVGWVVRDEMRATDRTQLVFATPGVALRWWARDALRSFDFVVLDEVHERSMEIDLLLALLRHHDRERVVAMSATIESDRVATWLGAEAVEAPGRTFPVTVRYQGRGTAPPDASGLAQRVCSAVDQALEEPGDVLVFLPGVGEIESCERALGGRAGLEVVPLHGRLSLRDQRRVFSSHSGRRVVLSTNVAETSLTVPGIHAVIDSGLVRRTRYHQGRGYLSLTSVARDAADQRTGRAGRLAPGRCIRLWAEHAPMDASTPPELLRERLVPLVLATAACGVPDPSMLDWLDPPPDYALRDAMEELSVLEAVDENGLTDRGRALFSLPVDPALGRLLQEANTSGSLTDVIDLVAAMETRRSLLRPVDDPDTDELREAGCDAVALIGALRTPNPRDLGVDGFALKEARRTRERLRKGWGLNNQPPRPAKLDRRALALTLLRADPRRAYLPRRHGRSVSWSNGGTEVSLGRNSLVNAEGTEALVALSSRAIERGHRDRQELITAAIPVPLAWLRAAGLGRRVVGKATLVKGQVRVSVERRHAGKVLETTEEVPKGADLILAIAQLIQQNRLFKGAWAALTERCADRALWARLQDAAAEPSAEEWLPERLTALGLQDASELKLLELNDLMPPELPWDAQDTLTRRFPRALDVADGTYRLEYEPEKRRLRVVKLKGRRREPPPLSWLPTLPGWRIVFIDGNRQIPLRR